MSNSTTLASVKQLCEEHGLSERKLHALRSQPWFPKPVVFGPRTLKWFRAEVTEALMAHLPRATATPEPTQLAAARARKAAQQAA